MIIISIVGSDPFPSFDPVKNKLQFIALNLIQQLDDCLKKLININEYITCMRDLGMTKNAEIRQCQVINVWRMKNSNKRIFVKNCFDPFEE
jgi:hypothetical protein